MILRDQKERAGIFFRICSCRTTLSAAQLHRHFERSEPTFSSAFALVNASARGVRNLSSVQAPSDKTGLPYPKPIDLYLLDCAKKRKKTHDEVVCIAQGPVAASKRFVCTRPAIKCLQKCARDS
jgi:hypothetical protein